MVFSILFLHTEDYSHVKVQAVCFTLGEVAFGLICSCLFVLPRLYRHLAAIPPYKSEEYELRKHKSMEEGGKGKKAKSWEDENDLWNVKREQEGRNEWERDIEGAVGLPDALSEPPHGDGGV